MSQKINRPKPTFFGSVGRPNLTQRTDMKRTTALFLSLAFIASLQLQANPAITLQPVSRSNNVGDNAQFTITATGTGTLSYQWRLNTVTIATGTTSTLNVLVTNSSQA